MLGVFALTVIDSGIVAIGLNPYYSDVVQGALLIAAVAADQIAHVAARTVPEGHRHARAGAALRNDIDFVKDEGTGRATCAAQPTSRCRS